ncbi:MAG TPA: CBS domain-containing protein [Flavitalea sp.]|nr:CBS domain-containing protein [Flavitalea sp.]
MLNKELISSSLPLLTLQDPASRALSLMAEFYVKHLPVSDGDQYAGIVFEDDLLNLDESVILETISSHFSKVSVHASMHFIEAVQASNDYHLDIIPVVEKNNEFVGAIPAIDLLRQLGKITGASDPGGLMVLEMDQRNFSFAEISKLVETNDAQITQLNTYRDNASESLFATIKINKFEISDIVATFQRYEYQVKYYFGEELYENELKDNYDHLMNYLNI